MAYQEILIMAMTRMRSGICTAGFVHQPQAACDVTWVRPIKEFGSLLLGDMCDAGGRVVEMGDVVEIDLLRPRPDPIHQEDWLADFIKHRPRIVRQLAGQKRTDFLFRHIDAQPADVLDHPIRSLCLIHPQAVWACFEGDDITADYQARLRFQLNESIYPPTNNERGMPVTDLKWRALGRRWLAEEKCPQLHVDHTALLAHLKAETIFLSIGLSRSYNGRSWPLVIGVHLVPDYTIDIDYDRL
jgi:hypothetical protein